MGPLVCLRAFSRLGDWFARKQPVMPMPSGLAIVLLTALFIGPLLGAALIFQDLRALFWLILVLDLILLFVFAVATFRQPVLFLGIMILWFALQRIVVAVVAPHVSADVVGLLFTYKEGFYLILVAAGAASLAFRSLRGEGTRPLLLLADALAVALLALLAIHFLADQATSSPQLHYLRRFAAPAILYLGGRLLIPSQQQLKASLRLVIVVALGVALFGVIERFFLGLAFWRDGVDAATFYARQIEAGLLPAAFVQLFHGVPDGIFIALPLEVPVRRLVSTYLEPTTLGSFLALATLLLLLAPSLVTGRANSPSSTRPRVAAAGAVLLLAFAITATLSRGGMLTVLAGLALLSGVALVGRLRTRLLRVYLALPALTLLTLGFLVTTFPLSDVPALGDGLQNFLSTRAVSGLPGEEKVAVVPPPPPTAAPDQASSLPEIIVHPPGSTAAGAAGHFRGLTSGLRQMLREPLGTGLGTAGNWSQAPEAGRESTVGAIAAQLGVPGFLLFIAFLVSIVGSLAFAAVRYRQLHQGPSSELALAVAAAMFGLFLISWFSESASGLLGNAFYFLFAGWALALVTPAASRWQFSWLPPPEGAEKE